MDGTKIRTWTDCTLSIWVTGRLAGMHSIFAAMDAVVRRRSVEKSIAGILVQKQNIQWKYCPKKSFFVSCAMVHSE